MVERLQIKASSIGRILTNLEKKYNNTHDKDGKKMTNSPSGQSISSTSSRRAPEKIQRIPPFNASKIKKSPSTEPAAVVAQDTEEESAWSEAVKEPAEIIDE